MPQKSNSVKIIILVVIVLAIVGGLIYSRITSEESQEPIQTQAITENKVITISNFSFDPKELSVSAGTKVVWKHNDAASHDVVSNTGLFKSPVMARGEEFSFIFQDAGEHQYYCGIHPSMKGKITVK